MNISNYIIKKITNFETPDLLSILLQNRNYPLTFKAPNSRTTERVFRIALTRAYEDMIPEPFPGEATEVSHSNTTFCMPLAAEHLPNKDKAV